MDLVLWVISIGLSAVFLLAGLTQLLCSTEQPISAGPKPTNAPSTATMKAIGLLQLAAAVGLALSVVLDIRPALVALVVAGLALLIAGAALIHARRKVWDSAS
jgi:hypothetical protein